MKFRIGISELPSSVSATAFDVIGCSTTATSREALDVLLPVSIAEHIGWLRRHGEGIGLPDAIEIDIAEVVDAAATDAQDGEFCFDDDLRPLTDDDLDAGLRAMSYARVEFLQAIEGLPKAVLDWRPTASAMAQLDVWKPQPPTIREIVGDVAGAEGYYRRCLADGKIPHDTDDAKFNVEAQRERAIAALRGVSQTDRARKFLPITPWAEAGALDGAQGTAPHHQPRAFP